MIMKKLIVFLALAGCMFFGYATKAVVQPADSSVAKEVLADSLNKGLTSNQLFELEKMKLEQEKMENEMMLEESPTDLVAIFVPIAMFLVCFLLFLLFYISGAKSGRQNTGSLKKHWNMDRPCPKEFLKKRKSKDNGLQLEPE